MKSNSFFNTSLLVARVILGITIAAHGAQKLLGWFGGYGYDGTMNYFTDVIGLPSIFASLLILAESIGMIALIAGFMSRIVSGSLILIMLGAIFTTHAQFGFFMNWFNAQAGEGFEFHLLVIALSAVIVLNGAGAYSVDAMINRNRLQRLPAKILFG